MRGTCLHLLLSHYEDAIKRYRVKMQFLLLITSAIIDFPLGLYWLLADDSPVIALPVLLLTPTRKRK